MTRRRQQREDPGKRRRRSGRRRKTVARMATLTGPTRFHMRAALLLLCATVAACGTNGNGDSPVATYNIAVDPADFPESENHWPVGEPIAVECWNRTGRPEPSVITLRTAAGERYAFTTALSPVVLRSTDSVRQVRRLFPPAPQPDEPQHEQRQVWPTYERGQPHYHEQSDLYIAVWKAAETACG